MPFPTRVLAGIVEISTGALSLAGAPPIFTGETGALLVSVTFQLRGVNYDVSSCEAEMYLVWDGAREMSEAVQMTTLESMATGYFPDSMTLKPGSPFLVIQLTDAGSGAVIVTCAHPVQITDVRGDVVITTRPGTPSEVIYVGRSPYIGNNGNWVEWNQGAYTDTGVHAQGDEGTSITSIAKTGTAGNVDTYTITMSNGATYTFTVTNGTSISSIAKTATAGLVDTYTITLTDGSSVGTFAVTNGSSVVQASAQYAKSASGTVAPSSGWEDDPADTGYTKGDFLWVRTTLTMADGSTGYYDSVSYIGLDGSGAVDSVNGQTGNVVIPTFSTTDNGLVPKPLSGDSAKFLKGDGTWSDVDALPVVSSSDNGKVLRVVNGAWAAAEITAAAGVSF